MQLYKPFKSKSKNKKYSVYVLSKAGNQKIIHFGSAQHQHYHDKLGKFSHLNHNDKKRRALYYKRHKRTRDKNTAQYWANHILWWYYFSGGADGYAIGVYSIAENCCSCRCSFQASHSKKPVCTMLWNVNVMIIQCIFIYIYTLINVLMKNSSKTII